MKERLVSPYGFEDTWMQLQDITLSKVSQAQKDKGHMFSLMCGK
jgi:hypothetical protein